GRIDWSRITPVVCCKAHSNIKLGAFFSHMRHRHSQERAADDEGNCSADHWSYACKNRTCARSTAGINLARAAWCAIDMPGPLRAFLSCLRNFSRSVAFATTATLRGT